MTPLVDPYEVADDRRDFVRTALEREAREGRSKVGRREARCGGRRVTYDWFIERRRRHPFALVALVVIVRCGIGVDDGPLLQASPMSMSTARFMLTR
jgi:hypothetical protein